MLHAINIMRESEVRYLLKPDDIIRVMNYSLYLHVIELNYDDARPLYQRVFEYMRWVNYY